MIKKNTLIDMDFLINNSKWFVLFFEFLIIIILIIVIISRGKPGKPKKPKKVKSVKNKVQPKVSSNVCKACGTVNDLKSKTCYVCGNLLK